MSERSEPVPVEEFDFHEILQQINSANPNSRLNQALAKWGGGVRYHTGDGTWESRTRKSDARDRVVEVHIGAEPMPSDTARLYNWGTNTIDSEIIVRQAHEIAHVLQVHKGLERALEDHLNGVGNTTSEQTAYVSLYDALNAYGQSVTGLSTEKIYTKQSIEANMSVVALEDMTELLGAYLLGDEYFYWRLNRIRGDFSDMEKLGILSLVSSIYGG